MRGDDADGGGECRKMEIYIEDVYVVFDASGEQFLKIVYEVQEGPVHIIGRMLQVVEDPTSWTQQKFEELIEADLRKNADLITAVKELVMKYKGQKISLAVEDLFEDKVEA